MRKKVILVIDDDEMNLQIAKMILERKLPCKVIGVDNGIEGIEILRTQRVNLVLLDVMMPDFDGIETLQEIRGDAQIKDIPVMMLTASGEIETIKKARLLGVKDYVRKPFLPADLLTRVEKKLAEEPLGTDIVLIGDDEKELENLKIIIENNFNHEVLIATNYEDSIEILNETEMSLIIACADMKFIDGFKLLAFIASNDKFKSVPFAVTTADKMSNLIRRINEINQPEVEKPSAKKTPGEKIFSSGNNPAKESPKADEKATDVKPKAEETPVVEKIADSHVAHKEKKKLANVVTNLIGYELDLKI